jgi:hypothetical protein
MRHQVGRGAPSAISAPCAPRPSVPGTVVTRGARISHLARRRFALIRALLLRSKSSSAAAAAASLCVPLSCGQSARYGARADPARGGDPDPQTQPECARRWRVRDGPFGIGLTADTSAGEPRNQLEPNASHPQRRRSTTPPPRGPAAKRTLVRPRYAAIRLSARPRREAHSRCGRATPRSG